MTSPFRPLHLRVLPALLASLLLACAWLTPLAQTTKRTFDIPAGEAEVTLKEFADQAGTQFFFSAEKVGGVRTAPLKGEFTPKEALEQMLTDTGLVAVQDEKTGALSVRRDARPNDRGVAQAASDHPIEAEDGKVVLEKYQVVGHLVDGLNNKGLLQGGSDAPLYHDVVTREDIDRMGVTSLEELFRLIPQTSSPANPLQDAVDNTSSIGGAALRVSTTSLRGFASAQTVILINGRSLPRTGTGDYNGPDLDRIPLASIERIEILPYAGSAIYGAGAIGGAINIILRKEYSGRDLTVYTGTSTDGGAGEYRMNYVDGRTFQQGRTSLTTTFSYDHRDPLRASQRDYLERALEKYGPDSTLRTSTGILAFEQFMLPALAGAPGTIVINNSEGPDADLGIPGSPGARYASVPAGTTPAASFALTPASFTATANTFNNGGRFGRSVLYEPTGNYSLNAQLEHVFIKDKLEGYGEFTLGYSRKKYTYPEQLTVSLSATDPLNPFRTGVTPGFVGRAVTVYEDAVDLPDSMSDYKYESARAVLGLKGKISEHWEWSVDGVIDYSHNTIVGTDTTSDVIALNNDLGLDPATTAAHRAIYPLLADHTAYPNPASDEAARFFTSRNGGSHSVQKEGNARLTGDLFKLPAGSLRGSLVSKLQDWSFTSGETNTGAGVETFQLLLPGQLPSSTSTNSRTVWQNAAEFSLPVIGKEWHPLPIQSFDLQGSASYEVNQTTANQSAATPADSIPYKYTRHANSEVIAGKLQLIPDIAFRASYSTGFYPPGWSDVSTPRWSSTLPFGFFPDAARGNTIQSTPWSFVGGGNPDLQPERAQSQNYGLIFTPRFINGLSLTVDYWKIVKTNAITTADFVGAWSNPSVYAFAVTRADPTPSDVANGWLGVVTTLDQSPINAAQIETNGIDARLRYNWDAGAFGTLMFNATATFTNDFELQISSLAPPINQLGAGGTAPLKWRGVGSVTWSKDRWSATVTGRYVGHYSTVFTDPSPAYPNAYPLDGGRIPAYLHWDLQATYSVPASDRYHNWRDWLSATKWTIGVNNVFDDEPAFTTGLGSTLLGVGTGFYSTFDDPRQRFVYLQVTKSL